MLRTTLLLLALTLSCLTGCSPEPAGAEWRVGLKRIAEGFASPVMLTAPDDGSGRLFIVDQVGVVWVVAGGVLLAQPFLDVRDRLVRLDGSYDERGLLGLAFHPDFASNQRFFVYYSAPLRAGVSAERFDHTSVVAGFTVSADDSNQADPASEQIVLAVDKPGYNYEAGHIAFGPDGYLYVALGDSARDPNHAIGGDAQDTSTLLGKILRIDVTAGQGYRVPPDNPFADGGGRAEIFAYGFRNPYRFSFDAGTQTLIVADVGHALMEEVDTVVPGGNYGWPIREGTLCFNPADWTEPLDRCAATGDKGEALIDPVIAYRHGEGRSAVIGGAVYHGKALPELDGVYLFGDWGRGQGRLFAARPTESAGQAWSFEEVTLEFQDGGSGLVQLLGFGQDQNLEMYLLAKDTRTGPTGDSGVVYQIAPP